MEKEELKFMEKVGKKVQLFKKHAHLVDCTKPFQEYIFTDVDFKNLAIELAIEERKSRPTPSLKEVETRILTILSDLSMDEVDLLIAHKAICDLMLKPPQMKWPEEVKPSSVLGINEEYWVSRINSMLAKCKQAYKESGGE